GWSLPVRLRRPRLDGNDRGDDRQVDPLIDWPGPDCADENALHGISLLDYLIRPRQQLTTVSSSRAPFAVFELPQSPARRIVVADVQRGGRRFEQRSEERREGKSGGLGGGGTTRGSASVREWWWQE